MKFDKVIYFRYIPLTNKIFHDFYMNELSYNGISIEYWDLSAIFFKKNFSQEDSSHLIETKKFYNYKEVETAIYQQDIEKTLFISIVTYEGRVIRLFKLFTKYNCKLAVFGRNMFPTATPSHKKQSILRRLIKITPGKMINHINNKKAIRLKCKGKIKGYDIVFLGGIKGWQGIGLTCLSEINAAQEVKVNSDDYDNAMMLINSPRIVESEYILFLDEYLPFHPDTKLFGIRSVTPEKYYSQLNSYFDKVEKQFGVPVVVAAHPKALKYAEKDYFDKRKIFFGKSVILSRDAKFVLAHDSTSINFPIIFNTPLHFITSRDIEKEIYSVHRNVITFAEYLNCNWQYIDNASEPVNLSNNFSSKAYLNYKYDFQCSKETENKQTKDIFVDFLKS